MMSSNVSATDSSFPEEVIQILSGYTEKDIRIDSEIYYDLGIYGEDLFDIFDFFIEKYNTDFSNVHAERIAPGEGGGPIGRIACILGFRPYRSFKVCDLAKIINDQLK